MVKVLAIDDNKDNLISLKAVITDSFQGSTVITALSGQEGIKRAHSENPDVILLDVVMPGMDGFEVCYILKKEEQLKDIPVVFLTALKESRENRIKALNCGAEAFLSKPIDETELIAQIRAMVKINAANKRSKNEKEHLSRLVSERTLELELSQKETLKLLHELKEENEARRKTEIILRESEQRWITTISSIGEAVIATDITGSVTFMNSEAENLTGWKHPEALNKTSGEVFKIIDDQTHEETENPVEKVIRNGVTAGLAENSTLINTGGEEIPIEASAAPIKAPNGRATGVVLVFRDITQRRNAEKVLKTYGLLLEETVKNRTAELEQAKVRAESADRLKSAFLANLSHELRTPLNSIIGFSGVLLQEYPGPLNHEQKKQMRMIQTSGRHLLGLINDILDLSKIESGQLTVSYEQFDVHEIIEEILRLQGPLAQQKGLAINLSTSSDRGLIESDKQRVQQILLNLVNNAIKFTEKGAVSIFCRREDTSVCISVSDTGIGIKTENIDKLFKPFIQIENDLIRRNEGSGLGLSICKKLIDLLEGEISVKSEYGTGSTFSIKLPLAKSHNI